MTTPKNRQRKLSYGLIDSGALLAHYSNICEYYGMYKFHKKHHPELVKEELIEKTAKELMEMEDEILKRMGWFKPSPPLINN